MKQILFLLALAVLAACSMVYIGDSKPRQQNTNNPACLIGCDASTSTTSAPASAASQ